MILKCALVLHEPIDVFRTCDVSVSVSVFWVDACAHYSAHAGTLPTGLMGSSLHSHFDLRSNWHAIQLR